MADTPIHIPELGNKFVDYRQKIWGNSFTWSWERPITQVKYAAIHHTVTRKDATPEYIAALHKARGWSGIGYHFLIPGAGKNNGKVFYVGDLSTARANVKNKNEQVLGISLHGDFTKELPSDAQIDSAHKLVNWMIRVSSIPNINGWDDMVGHKELQSTACPGTSWKGPPDSMYERIKNNIPYTPAPIPPEPEPQPPEPEPEPPVEPEPPEAGECCDFCDELAARVAVLETKHTNLSVRTNEIGQRSIIDWIRRKK